jgi:putative phosphonate metabolism protein
MPLYAGEMARFPRYAIYFAAPPGSALDDFGKQLLGYDAYTGDEPAFPDDIVQTTPDWADLTAEPRMYGFHATLKAPLVLATDRTEAELMAACDRFADRTRPIPVIEPVVEAISGFAALVPARPSAELARLAADCVRDFDVFRAPLTDAERARRRPSSLTPRQRDYLDRWGYPFVMEDFRFHMTLTGRLASDRRLAVLTTLQSRFATLGLKTLSIDAIAVFRQMGAQSRFRILHRCSLRAAPALTSPG